jgi:sialidase-1
MNLIRILFLWGLSVTSILAEVSLVVSPVEDAPVLRHKPLNPVLSFTLGTSGPARAGTLESVELTLSGTTHPEDIATISLMSGEVPPATTSVTHDQVQPTSTLITLQPMSALPTGVSSFWISITLKDAANLDGLISIAIRRVRVSGQELTPRPLQSVKPLRIGVALRQRGEDNSNSYRIPGLVQTTAGTLLASYDIRYEHCRDLPARIAVGISRSTNGGQTWEPMRIAMNPGSLGAKHQADGIGDAALLVDVKTGRIWLAALWSHGDRGWETSRPGMTPEETGQLLLTYSDDDGRTWAPLRNLTPMVKDPAWRLCFNGPGAGISMQDGTLVFPAMFRSADGGETQGKPFSTILWSKDQGATWTIGSGAKIDTTEAQVVELDDGSLMLNCRDNRGGSRTVMITRDLGKTWSPHPTDRGALPEPVCMASLLRWDHPRYGTLFAFSNPASTTARDQMTIKFSRDQAQTWPEQWHLRYDSRRGAGYSCLAPAGPDHLGVVYEGQCELYFMRIPLADRFR